MSHVTCPQCRASTKDGADFGATRVLRGEQFYLIRVHDDEAVLEPVDFQITGRNCTIEVVCERCGHEWDTRRYLGISR